MITAKATVKPAKSVTPKYPCLKQSRTTERVVLFLSPNQGVELLPPTPNSGCESYHGKYLTYEEAQCDPYEGAITISNA